MSPTPFLYFLFRKGQQAGPSSASQRYEDAMRFGSPAEKIREASRRTIRELFAFWIVGFVVLMIVLPDTHPSPMMSGNNFVMPPQLWTVLALDSLLFLPTWLLYRLIRFAIVR